MIIEEIINKFNEGGLRDHYSFATLVINLLKHHVSAQGKKFIPMGERDFFGDALIPDGFDNFIGSTLIEIKLDLRKIPISHFLRNHFSRNLSNFEDNNIKNVIIINSRELPPSFKERMTAELIKLQIPFNIFIWGPEELNKIAAKHKKKITDIASNLFSLRLESAISKPLKDWKNERNAHLENLRECYRKGQFSLFLGAGVSSSAGMPDWNTLLNSLFVTYLTQEFVNDVSIGDEDISELVVRLNSVDEPSALMAARYLRKGLTKDLKEAKEFTTTIAKNLYKLRNTQFPIDSPLITSIASMCIPRRTGAKIKSLVTYNFDDLLEKQLEKNSILYRCIYTENESYDPDELPVYHVHGFLPENEKLYDNLDRSTLVFSEEGYHQIYSDSYHWSNLVQLNNLRENHCLMVGLSMTDPNLRRLLEISSRNIEKSKHYAFMKRLSNDSFCYEYHDPKDSKQVITNKEAAEKFLDRHHALNEELMKELGVTIIWYESYDDIPEILKKIK